MNYLLDTHVILWLNSDYAKLSDNAFNIISDEKSSLYVSLVSLWEMQIKIQLGKLELSIELDTFWFDMLLQNKLEVLDIKADHILQHSNLANYHKDPFDRMLVAQAKIEGMVIITKDHFIPKYNVETIW